MTARALLLLLGLACAAPRSAPGPASPAAPIPDASLGLAKGSVFDVPSPPLYARNDSAPGELKPLGRAHPAAPPRVPHGVGDFLPITAAQNSCVDCHEVKEKEPGQPTPMPPSHYEDLRNAPGVVGKEVAGARWVCTSCHVPRTDAPPAVGSAFR